MTNPMEDFVEAYGTGVAFVKGIRNASQALNLMEQLRPQLQSALQEIQASPTYTADQKQAAQQMAVDLKAAIIAFADTL
jgi:hypothetical protein